MTDDWNKTFEYYDNVTSKNILKDNGVTFYQPDKIEFDKIKAATEPVVADFIKKMDALGFDGRKIVETFASAQN